MEKAKFYVWLCSKLPKKLIYYSTNQLFAYVTTNTLLYKREVGSILCMEALQVYADKYNIFDKESKMKNELEAELDLVEGTGWRKTGDKPRDVAKKILKKYGIKIGPFAKDHVLVDRLQRLYASNHEQQLLP